MGDPFVSAKIIKRPRKRRVCETCRKPIDGPQLRLYGAAEIGDPKWAAYIHPECTEWKHPKVVAAKA